MLSPLIEMLLAYKHVNGSRLVQQGWITMAVLYPPFAVLAYETAPFAGCYANIYFFWKEGPAIVPGTLATEASSAGVQSLTGTLNSSVTDENLPMWVEVTVKEPIISKWTNLTPLVQQEDFTQSYLNVFSEQDLLFVHELIRRWANQTNLPEDINMSRSDLLEATRTGRAGTGNTRARRS